MNLQAKCGFRRRQRGLDEEIAWAVDHVKGTALESRVFLYYNGCLNLPYMEGQKFQNFPECLSVQGSVVEQNYTRG